MLQQRTTEQAGTPAAQQIEAHPGIRESAQVQLVESGSPINSEDGAASGARFVMVPDARGNDPPDGGPGQIAVEIDLEAEVIHRIWARVIGDGDNDNSFFVSIDDDDEFIWDIKDRHGDLVRRWRWLPVKDREGRAATLDGGKHSLTFRNREDGRLLDAIFITSDPDLVPKGRTTLAPPGESVSI